ncbi:two-component system, NarL family, sensor histidine kinase BarA [Azotobacter vinelandii]|nr:two-component system, NarL family, sensor histidine kinase BarA [Azotobacter vinelandii]
MFHDFSIKTRIAMLTLLPSCLLALVLGSYFTWQQLAEMHGNLVGRGQLIVQQLAPLAAPALAQNYHNRLQRIANRVLDQTDIRAVSFLDSELGTIVHAGPSLNGPLPPQDPTQLTMVRDNSATHLLMPVLGYHQNLASGSNDRDDHLLGWIALEISHHNALLQGYRNLLASLLLILSVLLVSAFLALRVGRSISDPLRRIQQGVSQLRDGHLETRLPSLRSHELDELAAGINRMAEVMQHAQEEMQNSIDQATEDVRQNLETIEIQNIELDMARREALEASRIKSEFLANMSHEIRTPLNGIIGFTNLLQKCELTPRQHDYLNTIQKSADSLLDIINEILDFSKIEAGKLVLEHTPFNLRELIQDTLTILAPAAHAKHLELVSLIYRDTPLALNGDPQRLRQVLTNLISNAIKFTNEGTIAVRAMVEDIGEEFAQLRISVHDTGIGLSQEDLNALFQAFSQADNSLTRQAGGTGLGLVISKRLIEQMGGEIGVNSVPGEGSEFWIRLSLPLDDHSEDEPPTALHGHRVALLEQHELARQSIQHQLEDCGLEVQPFAELDSLLAGVAAARQEERPVGLAVLGVTSRDTSAEELAQRIADLERLGCKCLVLCPTTEQMFYQEVLPEAQIQLQSKPAHRDKLQAALGELLTPQPTGSQTLGPLGNRAPRLLCVDDNPANLLLVQTLLGDMGAAVTVADSGHAAVEAAQRERFDLIFMDVQMPGMDGRQATRAIRQWEAGQPEQRHTPIIALTAHALANERRALLQSGMDDYMTKPINERQLAQVVHKWTRLHLRSPGAQQVHEVQPASIGHLSVLDSEEGLRLAAGKPDLAADMLSMLLASLDADRQAIHQARRDGDRAALIERVHRLHGATRYCGVPQLRAACQHSETLLKQHAPAADTALDELDAAILRLAGEAKFGA